MSVAIASAADLTTATDPYIYDPHAIVAGKSLQSWSAAWWQNVFAAPIYAGNGTTFVNPQFLEGSAAKVGVSGGVDFLYGAFSGTVHNRSVTVAANTPLFVPLANSEWSNPDTPSAESGYASVPGNYTGAQLAHFADVQTGATTKLIVNVDGHVIPQATLFTHRETAPLFSYTLPKTFNIDQVYFRENISGTVPLAATDGYVVMLKPLSVGTHTVVFESASTDLSSTPPQLAGGDSLFTYTIKVVPTLVFSQQPITTVAGKAIAPALTVKIEDQNGNVVTSDNSNVTIAVNSGPSSLVGGTATVAAKNGVAVFSNIKLTKAGSYTLKAVDGSDTLAKSNAFTVNPAAAAKLAFGQQPTNVKAGLHIAPAVTVLVEDAYGNAVTTDTSKIKLTEVSTVAGEVLSGTTTVAAVGGKATFANLSLNKIGKVQLRATDGMLLAVISNSFAVS